ncbi:piriformospora indica-insensitive protein 2-like [Fagus crenata]
MVLFHPFIGLAFVFLPTLFVISQQQPVLDPTEQDALYHVLHSINPTIPWRSLYPDDLCLSGPHGVVCDYFTDTQSQTETLHVTHLSFGYVSDYTPNPPCSSTSTFHPLLFTSFKYLRKLFFYKCFNETRVSLPDDVSPSFLPTLEELVFIDNPSLVGPLSGMIRNYTNLRRVVLTGNGVYGEIPDGFGYLVNLEEITLSRNQLTGGVPLNFATLKNVKILDLSHNHFDGYVPDSLGNLTELMKLDLSFNGFFGQIPEGLSRLQRLEFLDLSFNRFGNFGIPLFLTEMSRLREAYLSGNLVGGQIPEIWENLGGILGIGLSNMGLVGNIPGSMGLHLRNLSYLGLDNNKLEGSVPVEFGLLKFVNEINLENNNLSGRVTFSVKMGQKLKLGGNPELCGDEGFGSGNNGEGSLEQLNLKVCNKPIIPKPGLFSVASSPQVVPHALLFVGVFTFLFVFA